MLENKHSYEQLLAENAKLREENRLLRMQLGLDEKAESAPVPESAAVPELAQENQPNNANLFIGAAVTQTSLSDEKIELFMSLFRGREDVYAKRWYSEKTGKDGYSPVCQNEWASGICDKRKNKCNSCPNRKFTQLNKTAIYNHLSGKSPNGSDVVGLYPMTEDELCWFLAIDFDDDGWINDVGAFRSACAELDLFPAVERSRSGNGGHVCIIRHLRLIVNPCTLAISVKPLFSATLSDAFPEALP